VTASWAVLRAVGVDEQALKANADIKTIVNRFRMDIVSPPLGSFGCVRESLSKNIDAIALLRENSYN
jgi:hypothetical protein